MERHFNDTEIVEISMACAMFNMINRLNDSFWTDLETEDYNRKQWNAVEGLSVEESEVYARALRRSGPARASSAGCRMGALAGPYAVPLPLRACAPTSVINCSRAS